MKLKTAISRLRGYLKYRKPDTDDNFYEAVALGIEALKAVKFNQEHPLVNLIRTLPGETPE
ncbi:hypothetical protein ES703_92454 [subsurface metagenome]